MKLRAERLEYNQTSRCISSGDHKQIWVSPILLVEAFQEWCGLTFLSFSGTLDFDRLSLSVFINDGQFLTRVFEDSATVLRSVADLHIISNTVFSG